MAGKPERAGWDRNQAVVEQLHCRVPESQQVPQNGPGSRGRLQIQPPAEGDVREHFHCKRLPVFGDVP